MKTLAVVLLACLFTTPLCAIDGKPDAPEDRQLTARATLTILNNSPYVLIRGWDAWGRGKYDVDYGLALHWSVHDAIRSALGGTYTKQEWEGPWHYQDLDIHGDVTYENGCSDRDIRAVRFGFLYLDYGNEPICAGTGLNRDAVMRGKCYLSKWVHPCPWSWSMYVGIVYVEMVRFADGQVWRADLNLVASDVKSAYDIDWTNQELAAYLRMMNESSRADQDDATARPGLLVPRGERR